MADVDVTLNRELVKDLLSRENGLQELVQVIVNQILEAEMTEHIGADRYQRSDNRRTHRNGYRLRQLYTRVGELTLRVPQARDGSFSTEVFRRYQRSEQALVLAMMEMVVQGVSTRKVSAITEELCGSQFSKSTVSQLCGELDSRVNAWNERSLSDSRYPFLVVDALVIKVRREGAVRPTSALLVCGVNEDGFRELLGIYVGNSETESTWDEMFRWLRDRGLRGVDFVVSDDHRGLVAAIARNFQGAIWQRCQTHMSRNVTGKAPKYLRPALTDGIRRIFRAEDRQTADKAFERLADEMDGKASKALLTLENALDDVLAVLVLPQKYRKRLRTTNMLERLNQEIRRRERVIRIFPNEASAYRLIGALLAEQHEAWISGKRYLGMDEYHQWRANRSENGSGVVTELRRPAD
ncbi:MAG TPA: IS256 family transposase [Rhodothermales bacterium]|nr:IS256 family transposase [Rhodothermales bacterium]